MGTIRTRRFSRAERILLETFAPLLRDIHRRSHILHEVISTLEHFRGVTTLEERDKLIDEMQKALALLDHFEVEREEHKPSVH
jgi:hypothetical protein